MVILPGAKKLENPYTVKNMKIAFENIQEKVNDDQLLAKGDNANPPELEIKTSHYYVKFKPTTEEQEGIIKRRQHDVFI